MRQWEESYNELRAETLEPGISRHCALRLLVDANTLAHPCQTCFLSCFLTEEPQWLLPTNLGLLGTVRTTDSLRNRGRGLPGYKGQSPGQTLHPATGIHVNIYCRHGCAVHCGPYVHFGREQHFYISSDVRGRRVLCGGIFQLRLHHHRESSN